uniref:Uncharacterized protein n=1 Tax=Anopheles atroparvus TaxID=41427 RepID=A0A182JAA5_ANOAO
MLLLLLLLLLLPLLLPPWPVPFCATEPPPVSMGCGGADGFPPVVADAAVDVGGGCGGVGRSISSSSARSNLRFFGCWRGVALWLTAAGFSVTIVAVVVVVVVPAVAPPGPVVLTATTLPYHQNLLLLLLLKAPYAF